VEPILASDGTSHFIWQCSGLCLSLLDLGVVYERASFHGWQKFSDYSPIYPGEKLQSHTSTCPDLKQQLDNYLGASNRKLKNYMYGRPALVDCEQIRWVTPLARSYAPTGLDFLIEYVAMTKDLTQMTESKFWYGA
jgi:hypothetical protein